MDSALLFVINFLGIFLVGAVAAIFFLVRKKPAKERESLLMLQQQLNDISKVLDNKLSESNKSIQEQFYQSFKVIGDVNASLSRVDQAARQVMGVAEQLQGLENILKNPKQRGILGEYYLEELLKNVFPPGHYQLQYQFQDGQTVDAVLFVRDNKIIPIDSKFSLENYNRIIGEKDENRKAQFEKLFRQDLKNRIEETAKYIRPQEGTLEFAFMFIPAEAIYYDLLVNRVGAVKSNTRDLMEYAVRDKHVIPVSPTSFYAYLQTVLQGLKAMQIEKSAMEIRKRVEMLGKHLSAYQVYLQKLGTHLGTSVNAYNAACREFGKIDKDVVKIAEGESRAEVRQIEKPMSAAEY